MKKDILVYLGLMILGSFLGGPVYGQFGFGAGNRGTAEQNHVAIELVPQYQPVGQGQDFLLAVVLEIEEPWHLYANPKQGELGLDTEIIPVAKEGITFGQVIYPAGQEYRDDFLDARNHIYEGRAVCYVPVNITDEVGGEATIELELKGLLCSDKGSCLPWSEQAGLVVAVGEEAGAVERAELFKDARPVSWQGGRTESGNKNGAGNGSVGAAVMIKDYQPVEYQEVSAQTWVVWILLAVAAGFFLNLMPCVLPVIPLVIGFFVQQNQTSQESGEKYRTVKIALVFGLGIILVFAGLALVMSVFQLFYGQQFQSNAFKLVILGIVYVLGLSMFGVFELVLPGKVSNISIVRQGYLGALGMGMLATILATPCSGPLLGPVLAWSVTQPTQVTMAVFLVIGVGMASPYVLLTAFPSLLNRIPKPGTWMILLKQAIAFVMMGITVYLIFLFEPAWRMPLLMLCVVVGFGIWLGWYAVNATSPDYRRKFMRIIAGAAMLLGGWYTYSSVSSAQPEQAAETQPQKNSNWLAAELNDYHSQGQAVLVKFTAKWCKNCEYLERTVFVDEAFKEKLKEKNIVFIKADLTQNDPAVSEMLERLGSQSLPFTVMFGAKDYTRPVVLRDLFGLETLLKVMDEAN